VRLGETLTVSLFFGWALEAAIGPCTDPRHIKVRMELGFVSSSSSTTSMSAQPTKFTIKELQARRQVEHEAEDRWREEEDRIFEEEVKRLAEEEEIWRRQEEAERKWKEEEEQRRRLEEAEKEYTRQKVIERARLGKQRAIELEESGEETEKEPEGSNKKVLIKVFNRWGIDKIQTGQMLDHTSLWEVCTGGRALPSEGAGARLPALWAMESRV
jgi:TolA-binding protein